MQKINNLVSTLTLFALIPLIGSCNYNKIKQTALRPEGGFAKADLTFATIKKQILEGPTNAEGKTCLKCHGELDNYASVAASIADIEARIMSNDMPKRGPPLSDNLKALLIAWIDAGLPEGFEEPILPPTKPPVPPTEPPPLEPPPGIPASELNFANITTKILNGPTNVDGKTCVKCHKGFTRYDVVAANAFEIESKIQSGEMPEGGPPLNEDLQRLLSAWIKAGTPEQSPLAP